MKLEKSSHHGVRNDVGDAGNRASRRARSGRLEAPRIDSSPTCHPSARQGAGPPRMPGLPLVVRPCEPGPRFGPQLPHGACISIDPDPPVSREQWTGVVLRPGGRCVSRQSWARLTVQAWGVLMSPSLCESSRADCGRFAGCSQDTTIQPNRALREFRTQSLSTAAPAECWHDR